MESQNINYCKNLLGLWFTEPDCEDDKYVHAFSFDKIILNNILENDVKKDDRHFFSISRVRLYTASEINDEQKKKIIILPMNDDFIFDNIKKPIYGFNKLTSDNCEQVLLCIDINNITDIIKEMGISSNPIKINTFYEESILNA